MQIFPTGLIPVPQNLLMRAIVVALFVAILAMWVISIVYMLQTPFTGDELFYRNGSRQIVLYFLGAISANQLSDAIVHNGWFLPGMSVLLVPVHLTHPNPGVVPIRLYICLIHAVLLVLAIRSTYKTFGVWPARALLVFPVAHATWQQFFATIWADLAGGLVLVVAVSLSTRIFRSIVNARTFDSRAFAKLVIVFIVMIYLRGSLLLVVLLLLAMLLVAAFLHLPMRRLMSLWLSVIGGAVLIAVCLSPWSLAVSQKFGGVVLTSTSPTLGFAVTFGDPDTLCFGPCPEGIVWQKAFEAIDERARFTGQSFMKTQSEMAHSATENLTITEYFSIVRQNFRRFIGNPRGFSMFRFSETIQNEQYQVWADKIHDLFAPFYQALFYLALVGLFVGNLWVFRTQTNAINGLVFRAVSLCLFVQPFVHVAHERYWPTYAPLAAVVAVFVWNNLRSSTSSMRSESSFLIADRYMIVIQICLTAFIVGVTIATLSL